MIVSAKGAFAYTAYAANASGACFLPWLV